jgi:hypothetical protein
LRVQILIDYFSVQALLVLLKMSVVSWLHKGFGGLEIDMLASGSRVRGFKPGRSHQIFLM